MHLITCHRCGKPYKRPRGQSKTYAYCAPCARDRLASIQKVHRAFNRALRDGVVSRSGCEVCADPKADSHHDDYSKPLEVRWLCRTHHRQHHAKAGPGLNAGT